MRVHVSTIGADCDEAVGVLETQVPGPGSPHRHPSEDDPVPVDGVVPASGLDRLEDVGLAGPAVAVLDPAQRVQLDVVAIRSVRDGAVALIEASEEPELAHPRGPTAAVEDDVEPRGPAPVVSPRHDQGTGLDRTVHGRDESSDDLAFLHGPWQVAGFERRHPTSTTLEGTLQEHHIGRGEGGVVLQGPGDPLGEHLRIGETGMTTFPQAIVAPQLVEPTSKVTQSALDTLPLLHAQG